MKVSIMQPNIFMWGGLLISLLESDLHIIRDDVTAPKNSRCNRNRIAGNSDVCWLTIPYDNFSSSTLIKDQYLQTTKRNNKKIISKYTSRYISYPYFNCVKKLLENTLVVESEKTLLCEIYIKFLSQLKVLGFPLCKFIFASSLSLNNKPEKKTNGVDMINQILKETGATHYLAAENTVNYADPSEYCVQNVYLQKYEDLNFTVDNSKLKGISFTKNLSCLDIISCLSIDETINHLATSNKWHKRVNY